MTPSQQVEEIKRAVVRTDGKRVTQNIISMCSDMIAAVKQKNVPMAAVLAREINYSLDNQEADNDRRHTDI